MLAIKILAPTLFAILTAVQIIRDWKYHDKRTRLYRHVTRTLLLAYLIPISLSAFILYKDSQETLHSQQKLDDVVSGKNDLLADNRTLRTQIAEYQGKVTDMQSKIDELIVGKNDLLSANSELLSQIARYQLDLKVKEEQIKELDIKSKMAARGVTSSYDFNGAKRETASGRVTAIAGPEMAIFQKMLDLEKNRNWSELALLCKEQTKKTPSWLTPYLFLGVSYANQGDKQKAIANFQHVIDNAPGDPNYAIAKDFLKHLRGQ